MYAVKSLIQSQNILHVARSIIWDSSTTASLMVWIYKITFLVREEKISNLVQEPCSPWLCYFVLCMFCSEKQMRNICKDYFCSQAPSLRCFVKCWQHTQWVGRKLGVRKHVIFTNRALCNPLLLNEVWPIVRGSWSHLLNSLSLCSSLEPVPSMITTAGSVKTVTCSLCTVYRKSHQTFPDVTLKCTRSIEGGRRGTPPILTLLLPITHTLQTYNDT